MKNYLCLIIAIFFIMSCQEDTNIKQVTFHSESQFQTISPKPQFEFQRTQCYVFFGNSSAEINNSEKFLVKNGLSSRVHDLPQNPNWRRLDSMYMKKDFSTMTTEEKNLYDQAISIAILRNHALLAEKDEKEKIAFYTDKFVNATGKSAGLLYYCLETLGNDLDPAKKQSYIQSVTARSEENINKMSKYAFIIIDKLRGSKSPYDSIRRLQQAYLREQEELEAQYIEKLRRMLI